MEVPSSCTRFASRSSNGCSHVPLSDRGKERGSKMIARSSTQEGVQEGKESLQADPNFLVWFPCTYQLEIVGGDWIGSHLPNFTWVSLYVHSIGKKNGQPKIIDCIVRLGQARKQNCKRQRHYRQLKRHYPFLAIDFYWYCRRNDHRHYRHI